MPSCSANNANLDKNNFDMFYKIDWFSALHGRIWMNNLPNESSIIILSWTEISSVISFSILRNWSQSRISLTHTVQCEYNKKGNPDLISIFWKMKRIITELISGMIVLLFLFHITHWSCILDNRWLFSNNFCKTCQNYSFFQVLSK